MTDLNQLRHTAARHLTDLLQLHSTQRAPMDQYDNTWLALDAIAHYAIAMAVHQMADITRDLMQKHAADPIIPNQTPKGTKP